MATEWRRTWSESCWLRFSTYCCLVIYHVQGGDCHWLGIPFNRLKDSKQAAWADRVKKSQGQGLLLFMVQLRRSSYCQPVLRLCCITWQEPIWSSYLEFLFGVPIWSVHSECPFEIPTDLRKGFRLHSQSNQSMGFPSRHWKKHHCLNW